MVGPSHFVEFINGRYAVYDKRSGVRLQSMTDLAFWRNAGVTLSPQLLVTDPRIVFDRISQRWFASQIDFDFSNQVSNRFLLGVSASSDPKGSWRGFAFPADPVQGNFADSLDEQVLAMGDLGYDFEPHSTLVGSAVQHAAVSGGAILTAATVVPVPPHTIPINPPQPDGSTNLDDGDARLSATSVDPSDPERFWTIQMLPSGSTAYLTQITELIVRPLALAITPLGTNVLVAWPRAATGFVLQTALDVAQRDGWKPVPQSPVPQGDLLTVTLPASDRQAFFRLVSP